MVKPELSIVIPCYNEAQNIPHVLAKFARAFKGVSAELILVDNNSKDVTQQVLKRELAKKQYSFARSVFESKPGYGAALKKGLQAARGEYVGWTHADQQTPPGDTVKALELLKKQKNPKKSYIKGNRYGRPFLDQFLTYGMTVFEAILFQKRFWDINAQPNVFHRTFLARLLARAPDDFAFDLYVYHAALTNGYTVVRFDVHFGKRVFGTSSWNTGLLARWKFIKRTIKFSMELRRRIA